MIKKEGKEKDNSGANMTSESGYSAFDNKATNSEDAANVDKLDAFHKCVRVVSAFFFSSRRRHTRWTGDWSSDVCSSDLRRRRRGACCPRSRSAAGQRR